MDNTEPSPRDSTMDGLPNFSAIMSRYERTYANHVLDGRTLDDALELALIDADDALTAWAVAS